MSRLVHGPRFTATVLALPTGPIVRNDSYSAGQPPWPRPTCGGVPDRRALRILTWPLRAITPTRATLTAGLDSELVLMAHGEPTARLTHTLLPPLAPVVPMVASEGGSSRDSRPVREEKVCRKARLGPNAGKRDLHFRSEGAVTAA